MSSQVTIRCDRSSRPSYSSSLRSTAVLDGPFFLAVPPSAAGLLSSESSDDWTGAAANAINPGISWVTAKIERRQDAPTAADRLDFEAVERIRSASRATS